LPYIEHAIQVAGKQLLALKSLAEREALQEVAQ
jgi:hypothetical protein